MSNTNLIADEKIEKAIYLIRGEKVMLDRDLASLYEVETGALNRAVKRNPNDSRRILCSTHERGVRFFEMPNWHLKGRPGWQTFPSVRFHRTGRGHAFECPKQRARCISQHRDHACVCKAATDACVQR